MATVKLADPGAVMAAYDAVMREDANWMLLGHTEPSDPRDVLALLAYGPGGLPELKRRMLQDPDQALVAFYREDNSRYPASCLLIDYIPPHTSAGLRARTHVHSRRLGALLKAHQTTLTVDSLAVLTATAIAQALSDTRNPLVIEVGQTEPFPADSGFSADVDQSTIKDYRPPPHHEADQMEPPRRSFSTQYSSPRSRSPSPPYGRSPSPPSRSRAGSMFSSLLGKRRSKRRARGRSEDLPPPTPPKDKGYYAHMTSPSPTPSLPPKPEDRDGDANSLSFTTDDELFADAGHSGDVRTPTMIELPRESTAIPSAFVPPPRKSSLTHRAPSPPPVQHHVVPLPDKWASVVVIPDPAERARRRIELQRQRDREEEEAMRQEEERQRRLKAEREAERRREEEEEAARKASLELEIKRATSERRRREQQAREEEERKAREIAERKRLDRLRRQEEHRRLEQWRADQARAAEEAKKREEQTRKSLEVERKRKIEQAEAKVKAAASDALITGWVTVQTPEWPLEWRRRFYKVMGDTLFLYRSQKDRAQYLDQVYLRGKLRGLKEWNEGYEELESIPYSFAIEFKDERGSWSAFADNEEEKFKLLALLKQAAGL
uniref:Expressed protein n=1 Tax=Schizophyllum commune (strain H4-8 / FGSC 9210) TaxID=578458 RepID=D8Q3N0_SCHCM